MRCANTAPVLVSFYFVSSLLQTRRALIDMHVRDMLRIMGAAPALVTLAQLERMAGPEEDEGVGVGVGANGDEGEREMPPGREATDHAPGETTDEEGRVAHATTPTILPTSPRPTNYVRFSSSSSGRDASYESQDPREPPNTSRAGQLTSGDFAWMMGEERRAEPNEQGGCLS